MKFTITMKDPDGFSNSVDEAVADLTQDIADLPEDEQELLLEARKEKLQTLLKTWFEYDEYLTVEVDTEAGTCTVVPRK